MPASHGEPLSTRQQPTETTISPVNLKSKLQQKLRVAQVLGIKRVLLLPFALLYVGMLLLLSRILQVRIHPIVNSRIGHFATNTELTLLKIRETRKNSKTKPLEIGCATSVVSVNSELERMWKRELKFSTGDWGWLINDICKRVQNRGFYQESTANDKEGRLISFPPTLEFTSEQELIGRKFLKNVDVIDESKIVCLNVRDNAFLSQSEALEWSKTRDWSYHDYRDSEISTYVAAAESLAEMGYTVFRMGAIVKEPLISKHPRVIDYATNGMRTEFLDVYLGANCKFCVSTGTGWDSIPQIFRRPSMYVNLLPHFAKECLVRDLLMYPKSVAMTTGKFNMPLKHLFEHGFATSFHTDLYTQAGVVIRDLSSEELVEAVTEMAQRVEGTFVETPEQKEMQAKLKSILSTHPKLQPSPNYYPIRAQFASCFLSRYPNFLDGLD
jgi:putative glycosyltransferase (TIGR04372 family)